MSLDHGIDVEECVELIVLCAAVAGDFACGNLTEDGHNEKLDLTE